MSTFLLHKTPLKVGLCTPGLGKSLVPAAEKQNIVLDFLFSPILNLVIHMFT